MKKNKVLKIILLLVVIVSISVSLFFIFKKTGITDIDRLRAIISKAGIWAPLIYILIRIPLTILLCFVPACSMIFDLLAVALFGTEWEALIICLSSVFLSSFVMDAIGRFGGNKIIIKVVGQKSYKEALKLIQTKGMVYVPIAYLMPIFPDDAICMVSGALKIKWWIHYIEIVLCRGIGCATVVLGLNILPQNLIDNLSPFNWSFISTHIFDYITLITVLIFWIIILLSSARKIDKWLTKKIKNKKQNNIKK